MFKHLKCVICMIMALALCAGAAGCGIAGPDKDNLTTTAQNTEYSSEHAVTSTPDQTTIIAQDNTAGVAAQVSGIAAQPLTTMDSNIQKGKQDPSTKTFTGLLPLPVRPVEISDPANSKHLPLTKIEHSYGAAKDGVVHDISKGHQVFFDQKNYAAVCYDNKSTEKALYLTFDCGYENGNTAIILDVLKEKQVPAAFFCTVDEMRGAPDIVARMINEGHIVGNHSLTHPHFSAINREAMAKELIEADNYLRQNFGYSAPFFRFPYGEYNESALDAVASLGFTSVFWSASYRDWAEAEQQGAQYAFDMVTSRIHPGCVLLLHSVSSDNAQAMGRIIDHARAEGYVFRHLTALPSFRP